MRERVGFFRVRGDDAPRDTVRGSLSHRCRGERRRGLGFWANRGAVLTGGHLPPPTVPPRVRRWGGQCCVTPRQTCPRRDCFGRNLRSKTRWFAGFCNSHHAPHFAAFFIGARAKISVAESHVVQGSNPRSLHPHSRPQNGMAPRPRRPTPDQPFLGALRARFGAHATPALCTTLLPARRRVPRTKWGRWRMRGRADAADQLWPSPPLCSTVTRSPVFPSTRSRQ